MNNNNSNRKTLIVGAVLLGVIGGWLVPKLWHGAPAPVVPSAAPPAAAGIGNYVPKPDKPVVAQVTFKAADGSAKSLKDFQGKVVLLNLWATWCAPCRKEMPDLNALQKSLGSDQFQVVALSVDHKGMEVVKSYLAEVGADALTPFVDESTKALTDLQGVGLPTTLLIDRQGRELGRLVGPAEWNSPEAQKLVKDAVAAQ